MGFLGKGWASALAPVQERLAHIAEQLVHISQRDPNILPRQEHVLRAFEQDFERVRVLIVGQDPYPTPGHAIGLAFATSAQTRPLPRSLQNIFIEMREDLGCAPPDTGDLSPWQKQGVMLLNRTLTVQAGRPQSHAQLGWSEFTECAVRALASRARAPIAVLWGSSARSLAPLFDPAYLVESAHPSPLSARRGFFGSRPFSRVNAMLRAQGFEAISWSPHDQVNAYRSEGVRA